MSVKLFCSPGLFLPRAISLRVKHVVLLKCRLLTTWGEGSPGRKNHALWPEYQWSLSDPLKHPLQKYSTVYFSECGWREESQAAGRVFQLLSAVRRAGSVLLLLGLLWHRLWGILYGKHQARALLATLGLGCQARTSLGESFFSLFFFFNQRTVALQYCVGLCCTSAWVSHRYIYIYVCVPSLLHPLPSPTPPQPSELSRSTGLSSLYHIANSHWLSALSVVMYVCVSGSIVSNSLWAHGR